MNKLQKKDDAVLGEKDKDGNYILYVAIADVARFVKQGSVIDLEAAEISINLGN